MEYLCVFVGVYPLCPLSVYVSISVKRTAQHSINFIYPELFISMPCRLTGEWKVKSCLPFGRGAPETLFLDCKQVFHMCNFKILNCHYAGMMTLWMIGKRMIQMSFLIWKCNWMATCLKLWLRAATPLSQIGTITQWKIHKLSCERGAGGWL